MQKQPKENVKKAEKHKELLKYFVTYFCILIPFLLLVIYTNNQTVQKMEARINDSVQARMQKLNEDLESKFLNGKKTTINIAFSAEFKYDTISLDDTNTVKTIRLLSSISNNQSSACMLAVLYQNANTVYSSSGKATADVYFSGDLFLTEHGAEVAKAAYYAENEKLTFLENKRDGYLLCHFPVSFGNIGHDVSVNYMYDFSDIKKELQLLAAEAPTYTRMVFDNEEEVLFYSDGNAITSVSADAFLPPEEENQYKKFEIRSEKTNVSLQVYYNKSYIFSGLKRTGQFQILMFVLCLTVALLLGWQFSSQRVDFNFKIRDYVTANRSYNFKGSMESFIQYAVSQIVEEQKILDQESRQNSRLLRRQNSELLFHGLLKDEIRIRRLFASCGIEFYGTHFVLTFVLLPNDELIQNEFFQAISGDPHCEVEVNQRKVAAILVQLPNCDKTREIRNRVGQELNVLLQEWGASNTQILYSEVFESLEKTGCIFYELCCTMETQLATEQQNGLVYEEDYQKKGNVVAMLNENRVARLQETLRVKSEREALEIVHQLCQEITEKQCSSFNRRYMRYSLIHVLAQEMRNSGSKNSRALLDIIETNIDNSSYEDSIQQVVTELCSKKSQNNTFQDVLAYIEENYQRSDLSLDEIATRFDMNRSHLSTLFHRQTGKTYVVYLTELRMKKAHALLVETNIPVKEIAEMVGYFDVVYFRKKFRSIYNENPSDLRSHFTMKK